MQKQHHYEQVAKAIEYIKSDGSSQIDFDKTAQKLGLNPAAFQQIFTEWAGVSPKEFFRFTGKAYAKAALKEQQTTLFDTGFKSKFPNNIPLSIEKMTTEAHENLSVNYSFAESPFGNVTIASTSKGICSMTFDENEETGLEKLKAKFPGASFCSHSDHLQQNALLIFQNDPGKMSEIKLHIRGTDFQLKVWELLLKIPSGQLSTYGRLAEKTGDRNASRAVGTAVGKNPVAYLIPCHRVVRTTGELGGYMWGKTRKAAIIAWEYHKNRLKNR